MNISSYGKKKVSVEKIPEIKFFFLKLLSIHHFCSVSNLDYIYLLVKTPKKNSEVLVMKQYNSIKRCNDKISKMLYIRM